MNLCSPASVFRWLFLGKYSHSKPESVDILLIKTVVGHSTEVSAENFWISSHPTEGLVACRVTIWISRFLTDWSVRLQIKYSFVCVCVCFTTRPSRACSKAIETWKLYFRMHAVGLVRKGEWTQKAWKLRIRYVRSSSNCIWIVYNN